MSEGKNDPIWVESLLTPEEHIRCHKLYPSTVQSKPVQFMPNIHVGGKWRAGMGKGYTETEIFNINKSIEQLRIFLKNKEK